MKRVALELGGKSPNIVFEDADLDLAAAGVMSGIFGASGQMCSAGSRLLVHSSIKDIFLKKLLDLARDIRLGDPMDPKTNVGPISTPPQYQKVLDYIDIAHADGARCVLGGKPAIGEGLLGGQFVEPTIFVDVRNDMRIAQEEVFGPILSVIEFADENEACLLGNDVAYGLVAGIWTSNIGRALRVSKALAGRHSLGQYLSHLQLHGSFRRHEEVRSRKGARDRGRRRIPRDQERRDLDRR